MNKKVLMVFTLDELTAIANSLNVTLSSQTGSNIQTYDRIANKLVMVIREVRKRV